MKYVKSQAWRKCSHQGQAKKKVVKLMSADHSCHVTACFLFD